MYTIYLLKRFYKNSLLFIKTKTEETLKPKEFVVKNAFRFFLICVKFFLIIRLRSFNTVLMHNFHFA